MTSTSAVPVPVDRLVLGCSAAQWKLLAWFLALSLIPITGLAIYIRGSVEDLQVRSQISGLMNFADAKQQGVISFVGQGEKLAKTLAVQVQATGPESVQPLFASIVKSGVFRPRDHPFKEEIAAGTRRIPTWRTYRAVDFVRDGVVTVSSDPARVGRPWAHKVNLTNGYSDVYLVDGKPYLTFGAKARGGMVYVHADALILTDIVNGEIGNLEGDAGAFYLAGEGKTFDYYLVNRDNVMITESRVYPNAVLRQKGSVAPWERTHKGAQDPMCTDGKYMPHGGVATGCREAMGYYQSVNGHEMLGASMPFYDSGWTIVVEQHAEELLAPFTAVQQRIWTILGLIVLAIMILGFSVARHIAVKDSRSRRAVHEASHDSLTGLPARTLFMEQLERAVAVAAESGTEVSLLFIDLARFKTVNDTLGHKAGDELLTLVAQRIRGCLRDPDIAGRFGGDEFAVILQDTTGASLGLLVGDRIIQSLKNPFLIAGKEIFIAASIGVAFGTGCSQSATEFLSHADLAMYRAKKEGSLRPVLFKEQMLVGATASLELPGELHRALGTDQLWLQYQPMVDIGSSLPVGVEVLARWTHPTRGAIPPVIFIPIAEETGAIVELGRWVLRESCRQVNRWRQEGFTTLTLNVNVSASQLLDGALAVDVQEILAETGLPPSALTLELTETVLMNDPAMSLERLQELKDLGVRIAIDDFGTGYSSLAYLRQFPVDELKIDKSFIDRIGAGPEEYAIVRTIIELAQTLDMQTTAEGIETPAQLEALRLLGCDVGQGDYLTRPLDVSHVSTYLDSHNGLQRRAVTSDSIGFTTSERGTAPPT